MPFYLDIYPNLIWLLDKGQKMQTWESQSFLRFLSFFKRHTVCKATTYKTPIYMASAIENTECLSNKKNQEFGNLSLCCDLNKNDPS